jgi:DNA replication licensing factor MCM7
MQEVSSEVPEGATPRFITMHLRGDLTRSCKPGDEVIVSGIFLPEPFTGPHSSCQVAITSIYAPSL